MNEERPQLRKPYQKTAIQPEAEPTGGFIHSGQMKKEGESGMSAFEKELKQIARTAGNMFSTHKMSAVDQKEGHANFVTNIDREVEDYLQSQLLALVPGSKMIGEEQENESLSDNPTWIVDPVDGTTNLIHDYRLSAVSIARCNNKRPIAGLVFQPYTPELFYAERGCGAFLNEEPIHVADMPFSRSLVGFGTAPYYEEMFAGSMALARAYLHACADIRRSGSAAVDLAYVACGRLDVFVELRLKPWDYAAGSLLVQEAGGVFDMPFEKNGLSYGQTTAIFAASAICYKEARTVFDRIIH